MTNSSNLMRDSLLSNLQAANIIKKRTPREVKRLKVVNNKNMLNQPTLSQAQLWANNLNLSVPPLHNSSKLHSNRFHRVHPRPEQSSRAMLSTSSNSSSQARHKSTALTNNKAPTLEWETDSQLSNSSHRQELEWFLRVLKTVLTQQVVKSWDQEPLVAASSRVPSHQVPRASLTPSNRCNIRLNRPAARASRIRRLSLLQTIWGRHLREAFRLRKCHRWRK